MRSEFHYSNSYLKRDKKKKIDHIFLNEKDYYSTGYAYGMLMKESKSRATRFTRSLIAKFFVWFGTWFFRNRFEAIQVPEKYDAELRGMSDATGIPYKDLFFFNFIYEAAHLMHCSTFSFFNSDGNVVIGHNSDFGPVPILSRLMLVFLKSNVTEVRMPHHTPYVHVGMPFQLGPLNGYNAHGIAVNTHSLSSKWKDRGTYKRISSIILYRMILEQASGIKEAEATVEENKPFIPCNIAVTSAKEKKGVVIEVTPHESATHEFEGGYMTCTNHFRTKQLRVFQLDIPMGSKERCKAFQVYLDAKEDITVAQAAQLLKRTRPGVRSIDKEDLSVLRLMNVQSFVFDMSNNTIHISNGSVSPVSVFGKYIPMEVMEDL